MARVRKIIAALNRVPFWGTPLCKTPRSTFYEVPVSFLVEKFEPETFYQRPPNPARYEHMATVKLASGADPHFMGVISCFDFGNNPLPASQKVRTYQSSASMILVWWNNASNACVHSFTICIARQATTRCSRRAAPRRSNAHYLTRKTKI